MNKTLWGIAVCAATPFASAAGQPDNAAESLAAQQISRAGTQASAAGPADYFSGRVRVDPLFPASGEINASGAYVTFEPGARSAWHTHPLGQTLVVTSGCGWTQCEGEPIVEIRAGDVIWCPPGHKHWHGASATTSMTHIAIQEALNGVNVVWMEKVSDEQYLAGPPVATP
jgi:quercetin dioxygenase-like cupin family protein